VKIAAQVSAASLENLCMTMRIIYRGLISDAACLRKFGVNKLDAADLGQVGPRTGRAKRTKEHKEWFVHRIRDVLDA
jgi:hypothetical protein